MTLQKQRIQKEYLKQVNMSNRPVAIGITLLFVLFSTSGCLNEDTFSSDEAQKNHPDGIFVTDSDGNALDMDILNLSFGGVIAWLIWLFVHLIAITNFKNKLMIFTQWFWGYLTSQRHSRIIR